MALYQQSVLKKYLATQDKEQVKAAYGAYSAYFLNKEIQENIRNAKEEQFQQKFLMELFVNIMGYVMNPDAGYNLTTELKNIKDAKKTDGAILNAKGAALAVIELKGTDTKDLDKVNDQAFNYKNNQPDCDYVITSNFEKLRFYIHNAVEHEEFNLFTLSEERFALLWLFLQKDNLLGGIPAKVKDESLLREDKITKALYADYSAFKNALWTNMVERNPQHDHLLLYKKSQKLLDRFLFIFFAEDKGLLPPNSISVIIEQWQKLKDLDEYKPLYDRFKKYFGYMNNGYKGAKYEIHAYNGGLFKADELLDGLLIDDELLKKHCLKLTNYDFADEVDTNILGHIFEHSLNDIENVRAQLAGEEVDKSKTKRKKDGVFYTPKYITKYIVDNTVGKLCEEKKAELGIDDEEFAKDRKGRKKETIKKLNALLKEYRQWLLQLTICDPACGSGAFLNQALEFLMAEHHYVDELEAALFEGSIVFQNVENHILENNIYGVDINEESVEIARLSLWLRTAKKGRKLTSLSSNIKCGNSLIDDPEVAGDLAFNWQNEFPSVFAKGGFDVVIGNPPYVRQELISEFKPYFEKTYKTYSSTADLYTYFIEMGVDKLINNKGIYSIIVGNKWMRARFAKNLRLWMRQKEIIELIDFGDLPVFENVSAYPVLVTLKEKTEHSDNFFYGCEPKDLDFDDLNLLVKKTRFKVDATELQDEGWSLVNSDVSSLISKLKQKGVPFDDFVSGVIYRGIVTGYNEAFVIDATIRRQLIKEDQKSAEIIQPFLAGRDIKRYYLDFEERYILFTRRGINLEEYPAVKAYLEGFREKLEPKPKDWKGNWAGRKPGPYKWYEIQDSIEYYKEFEKSKIIYPNICIEPQFCLDEDGFYTNQKCFIIPDRGIEILGILNSSLYYFLFRQLLPKLRGGYYEPSYTYLKDFPLLEFTEQHQFDAVAKQIAQKKEIKAIQNDFLSHLQSKFDLPKPSTKLKDWPSLDFKGFLAELKKAKVVLGLEEEAEWMAYFNKKKAEANALQSEIDRIDKEIDQMVYALYELSPEEIAIVENS